VLATQSLRLRIFCVICSHARASGFPSCTCTACTLCGYSLMLPYLLCTSLYAAKEWILQNGSLYRAQKRQESDDQRSTRSMHSIGTRLIIATLSLQRDVGLSVPFMLHFPLLRYQIVYFSIRSTRPYHKRDKRKRSKYPSLGFLLFSWAVPCS
jgi:hypothetical protein